MMQRAYEWLQALPNWQPYGEPKYFAFLLVFMLPIIIAMLFGRRLKIYQSVISLGFIVVMYTGASTMQLFALIGYVVWQTLIVFGYHQYRKKFDTFIVFALSVFLAVLPLVFVKVTPAIEDGNNSLFGFLGISYLTFRSVAMIMEMRDGVLKEITLPKFLRFMLFMPTISSGPIDRYRRFEEDYDHVVSRVEYLDLLEKAVWYLMLGFLYKYVLAYFFGTILLVPLKAQALLEGGIINWPTIGVMYAYGFDLFFDFAGYSLFAVAISYMMGIKIPMNFNQPFKAPNIKDFWNRWHISLSFWFRDFVFMRIVFVLMKNKVFKNRNTTANVTYVLNMLIMGFWHGVTWYYITYGLLHGIGLVANDMWLRKKKTINKARRLAGKPLLPSNKWTTALGIVVTFQFVMFSFLLFSGFLNQLWFQNIK